MRIGRIKNFASNCSHYSEDDVDMINNLPYCIHCHEPRICLHRITNKEVKMRVCINPKCFAYTNIIIIKTWIKD